MSDVTLNMGNLDACDEPFALFALWLEAARRGEPNDPEAMALATVDAEGRPDLRMVLCKGVEDGGLTFYTNAESAKGRQIEARPVGAALFHWKSLRRQARFRGPVRRLDEDAADAYFALARPRVADRRLGKLAVAAGRLARFARVARRPICGAFRRHGRAAAALLARLPARGRGGGIVGQRRTPPARPHPLHPRRRGLGAAEAQPLSETDDRTFPPRPILAVSTAVFRDGRALIARRAKAPWRGAFSLPGGVVEIGETLMAAAARELAEEVGVEAEIVGFVRHVEPIHIEAERVRAHFVIAVFAARWRRGEPALSAEVDEIAWVDPRALGDRLTTPELPAILAAAAGLVGG